VSVDVLHVLPDLQPGGAEQVAVQLLRGTDPRRFRTGVVCLGPAAGSRLEAALARDGVPMWHLGKGRGFQAACCAQLARVIRASGARLLHTHRHVMPYVLPALLGRRGTRCVHTTHNLAPSEVRRATQWFHRAAFRFGAVPVAIAHAVRASLRALYGVRHVPLIPNGVPVARYAAAAALRGQARAALGLPEDAVAIACCARLVPQKNHALLLDSFAGGPAPDPRVHLLLAGDGPLRAALERQARSLGLARVRFLGDQPDVVPLLAASDIVVLASRWEGSPLAVLEAMAAGRPVVATAAGGVPELVRHEATGLLVPLDAPRELARALQRLVDHPAERERLGRAGQQRARRDFDAGTMTRRYEALYAEVLA
jgi:glycosyltransferase involved in cell wall biosynthesis